MQRDEIIYMLKTYFSGQPVLRVWLFGSFARNEHTEESDIDVLVELDKSKPIGLEYAEMYADLQDMFRRKVDLVSEGGVSRHVKPFIEKDKVLIYERKFVGQSPA